MLWQGPHHVAVKSTTTSLSPASARALSKPSCEHKSMLDFMFCHQYCKELFQKQESVALDTFFIQQKHDCDNLQRLHEPYLPSHHPRLWSVSGICWKDKSCHSTPLHCCSRPAFISLCAAWWCIKLDALSAFVTIFIRGEEIN